MKCRQENKTNVFGNHILDRILILGNSTGGLASQIVHNSQAFYHHLNLALITGLTRITLDFLPPKKGFNLRERIRQIRNSSVRMDHYLLLSGRC